MRKIEDFIDVIVDEVASQPESSKINMNLDGEENQDMRSIDLEKIDSNPEGKEEDTSPRPKLPSMYVQKEHPKSHILVDQRHGVKIRRRLLASSIYENMALLSLIEPKNLGQASEDMFWVKVMNE